mgnify:CR=1 FL=1
MTFSLLPPLELSKTIIFQGNSLSIWQNILTLENFFVLGMNISITFLGCLLTFNKFGLKGLIPIIVQLGYYAGNAISMTSGGRYTLPVSWINILYFSVGLIEIFTLVYNFLGIPAESNLSSPVITDIKNENKSWPFLVSVLFIFLGLLPVLIDKLPKKLPQSTISQAHTYDVLSEYINISQVEWNDIVSQPKFFMAQGFAYHPNYYRNVNYFDGNSMIYQHMILTPEQVIVSNLLNVTPQQPFTDGSSVIVLGCRVSQDRLWAARRIILETLILIQLDNEKAIYIDEFSSWACD